MNIGSLPANNVTVLLGTTELVLDHHFNQPRLDTVLAASATDQATFTVDVSGAPCNSRGEFTIVVDSDENILPDNANYVIRCTRIRPSGPYPRTSRSIWVALLPLVALRAPMLQPRVVVLPSGQVSHRQLVIVMAQVAAMALTIARH